MRGISRFWNDRSAQDRFTTRIRILTQGAVQSVSQQVLRFIEGMETLETVEAYTEKPDGRRVVIDPTTIFTRDGASGLQTTYLRDLKQRTLIFPDVAVGDTLVMTHNKETVQTLFPGQFMYTDVVPRSRAFDSFELTIEAPAALPLQVGTTGTGVSDRVEIAGDSRRHFVSIGPAPYRPEEIGAVAAIDRDPAVLVSTFKSYEELGQAYGAAAYPKMAPTPDIVALANEITSGINDKRAQAAAIDAWVKKNIRYVAIFLSLGRVIPNNAATVLKNKFGDCKDKATLMAALLAAKGIASEAALINSGNVYTLPEPPTLVALNHVILYLPDFDLYDDPTADIAAFGVLALPTYDKPVVRVSATSAKLARTPAMRPADHTIATRSVLNFASDGAVTGETTEVATGAFAESLRLTARNVGTLGNETAAQRQLQLFNTPGSGRFDLGNAAETFDPVTVKSSFTLKDRFRLAPSNRAVIAHGMPLLVRPGNFLLGRRLSGRMAAFVCYAGRQTEDIEATFAPGLPMPVPLVARNIENATFSYRSSFLIEGRTLKAHREFVSRVTHQVCPPELEAEIAEDMNAIRINVSNNYAFRAASAAVSSTEPVVRDLPQVVAIDQRGQLDFLFTLNPDCSSIGFATVRVVDPPKNGTIAFENGTGFSTFPQNNMRVDCNKRRSEGVLVFYRPNPGYAGTDVFMVDIIYASGRSAQRRYTIEVK